MQREKARLSKTGRRRTNRNSRGVALISTLLLLVLLTGLTLAMAWSTQSDLLIGGYYRNFRGSFYAADSGLSTVHQALKLEFTLGGAAIPGVLAAVNPLPSPATEAAVIKDINAKYGVLQNLTGPGHGQAANSWPERFLVTNFTLGQLPAPNGCIATPVAVPPPVAPAGGWTCANIGANAANYTYNYSYSITVQGQSKGTEATTLIDRGLVTVSTKTAQGNANLPFAAWGMFIDQYGLCSGGTLVPGTITGPTFTNGSWNFGNGGTYHFTDQVGQVGTQAGYSNGNCVGVAGPAGNGIAPTFDGGFQLGQKTVPLPQNSFNQQRAVIDGKGVNGAQPSNSELNSSLRDASNKAYPAGGTSSGVFLPYTQDANKNLIFTGGGIMVQGDAQVQVLAPSNSSAQIYKITQGGVTTTVTIDPKAVNPMGGFGTTTISNGSSTQTINGYPEQFDPSTNAPMGYATMLYVNGNITNLAGPGAGKPGIQDGTALTITGNGNITITGDLLYTKEPVTGTPSTPGTPIDTLIPGNDTKQALGIFTAKGDIQMNNSQSSGNLEIDASIATISQGGSGALTNTGNTINLLTIVGGRIQNTIQNINTKTRNVMFDQRYAGGQFAPPFFPSTPIVPGAAGGPPQAQAPVVTRLQWQNTKSDY